MMDFLPGLGKSTQMIDYCRDLQEKDKTFLIITMRVSIAAKLYADCRKETPDKKKIDVMIYRPDLIKNKNENDASKKNN